MLLKLLNIRKKIRINMRILRKSLTLEKQYNASIKISEKAFHCSFIFHAKNIAIFLPFDGEINTYPLILKFWARKNKVFLPVIKSFDKKKLFFVRFTQNSILHCNKYKIFEPVFSVKDIISISNLDVVIVPLVAFDKKGVRLGMGGGFYDVFLKKWHQNNFIPVGLAYNFQLVDKIPSQFWDIPLPTILTPKKIWSF